ncbi:hypothetical protein D6D19_03366 [Aureobasidium pullulans]|uniref:Ribonuclease P/MRP protein subunit POP5 n=1 Tax=Aureobasidium pullulans TaxID=5580 RepID=A0A4S9AAB3_AURPU|nr:hypothetical protein D6D19_03366 [Aureobasidium pullulans]
MVRLKHRYLLLNILYPDAETPTKPSTDADLPHVISFRRPSSDKLNAQLLARIIRDGVAELFGDYGSGMIAASLVVKYLSPATSTAIVRVSRAHYRLVWAALSFVTRLPKPIDQNCVIQVVRVSGTIRKAEEEAIRRAKAAIIRATARDKGAEFILDKMLGKDYKTNTRAGASMGIISDDDEDQMDED